MLEELLRQFKILAAQNNKHADQLAKKKEFFSSSNDDSHETHGYSQVSVLPLGWMKGRIAQDELIAQLDTKNNVLTITSNCSNNNKSSLRLTLTEENTGENFKNIIQRLPAVHETSKDTYLISMIASTFQYLLKQPKKQQSSDNPDENPYATITIVTENGLTPPDKDGYVIKQAFVETYSVFKDKNVFTKPEQSTQDKTEKVESHYKPVLKLDTYEVSNYPAHGNVTNTASVYTKKF